MVASGVNPWRSGGRGADVSDCGAAFGDVLPRSPAEKLSLVVALYGSHSAEDRLKLDA